MILFCFEFFFWFCFFFLFFFYVERFFNLVGFSPVWPESVCCRQIVFVFVFHSSFALCRAFCCHVVVFVCLFCFGSNWHFIVLFSQEAIQKKKNWSVVSGKDETHSPKNWGCVARCWHCLLPLIVLMATETYRIVIVGPGAVGMRCQLLFFCCCWFDLLNAELHLFFRLWISLCW